jgi:hypothetical protein
VTQQIVHRAREVREIPLDFDEVLFGAVGQEEVVVMLNPLQFMTYDHGATELSVLQRARVTSAWSYVNNDKLSADGSIRANYLQRAQ